MERVVKQLASQKPVVIFSRSTCCMCHSVQKLFHGQGVSPLVIEIDRESNAREIETALKMLGCGPAVPAVFIGGKLVGSMNNVLTLHLDGSLKDMLKDAGALWL